MVLLLRKLKECTLLAIIGTVFFCTLYWYNMTPIHHRVNNIFGESNQNLWQWDCNYTTNMCERKIFKRGESGQSMKTCQMTCGLCPIWPYPNGDLILSNKSVIFNHKNIVIMPILVSHTAIGNMLRNYCKIFLQDILPVKQKPVKSFFPYINRNIIPDVNVVKISIRVFGNSSDIRFRLGLDESYKLTINEIDKIIYVTIKTATYFGAVHSLETLKQLIWFDESIGSMRIISNAKIFDAPSFSYRGLLLDTANHFIPVPLIKSTLIAMAAAKFNILHWRMTDVHNFPLYLPNIKENFIYGSSTPNNIYNKKNIKNIVNFAELRGITVLIEVENPGNIKIGWDWGPRLGVGNLNMYTNNKNNNTSPFSCNLMNPDNDYNYKILKEILSELHDVNGEPPALVHLGGSSINATCWKNSLEINEMEAFKRKGIPGVLKYHQNKIFNLLLDLHNKDKVPDMILWSDYFKHFNDPTIAISSKLYIAQVSGESTCEEEKLLINRGYRVILSHSDKWFLNKLPLWSTVYTHKPWEDFLWSQREQVLGGEACLWTDLVDKNTLEITLWPNAGAIAEVLWSDPDSNINLANVQLRLEFFREYLLSKDIKSTPITPQGCVLNPSSCF